MSFNRDPIEGLIQYVKDIKPYHTKLIDVIVTYTYDELINVLVEGVTNMVTTFDMDYSRDPCQFGYDTDGYDTTAYDIPDFSYAINHSNAYSVDCLLPGCTKRYKTTISENIPTGTTMLLPFYYLYNIDTLYVYVNGAHITHGYTEIPPDLTDIEDPGDADILNSNRLQFNIPLPANTRLLITTHDVGNRNECWDELSSSGFESHTFDEHGFDLDDPTFDKNLYGFEGDRLENQPFDWDLGNKSNCGCDPIPPYASPTTVLPTFAEHMEFSEIMPLVSIAQTTITETFDISIVPI